jgi:hypothetical protein
VGSVSALFLQQRLGRSFGLAVRVISLSLIMLAQRHAKQEQACACRASDRMHARSKASRNNGALFCNARSGRLLPPARQTDCLIIYHRPSSALAQCQTRLLGANTRSVSIQPFKSVTFSDGLN